MNKINELKKLGEYFKKVSGNGRFILDGINNCVQCRGHDGITFMRIILQQNDLLTLSTHFKGKTIIIQKDLTNYSVKRLLNK